MEFLPREVLAALQESRKKASRPRGRLHVEADGETWRVLRRWRGGFGRAAAGAAHAALEHVAHPEFRADAPHVDSLAGLGAYSTGDLVHVVSVVSPWIARQATRAAILMSRLSAEKR